MTPEIGQIAITVSDVATALPFYRDVLGLAFLFQPAPNLEVEGIEAAFADMRARGAGIGQEPRLTARMPDHELWIATVRDPDGNLVGLMEEKRP